MVAAIYPLSTAVSAIALLLAIRHAWGNSDHLVYIVTAMVFGYLIEKAAIIQFGIYSYPAHDYIFQLWGIPLEIPMAWGAIMYGGLMAGKHIGLKTKVLPVFTAMFALHFDLAIDAIAIRIPLWTWHVPGAWFGVPVGNFFAWYAVPFVFTAFFLYLKERIQQPVLLGLSVMGASSVILMGLLQFWATILMGSLLAEVIVLGTVVLISLVYLVRAEARAELHLDRVPVETFMSILLLHLFYFTVLLYYGYYQDIPALLYISVAMILAGISIHYIHHWPEIKERVKKRFG